MSLQYPIGIIEQGQIIKRPITINAGEIKHSSQLLLLSFSDINQCPSPTHTLSHTQTHISLTDWRCCVYLRKRFNVCEGGVQTWGGKDKRRRRRFSRAEINEMWQAATLLIIMTQLSQPYFRKIKQPYGKLACLGGGAGGGRSVCVCVKINKLVVFRWAFCFSPPPFCFPPSSTSLSFDMVMAPNWWRHFTHSVTTLLASDINTSSSITQEAPPSCLLSIGWAGNCLIS